MKANKTEKSHRSKISSKNQIDECIRQNSVHISFIQTTVDHSLISKSKLCGKNFDESTKLVKTHAKFVLLQRRYIFVFLI